MTKTITLKLLVTAYVIATAVLTVRGAAQNLPSHAPVILANGPSVLPPSAKSDSTAIETLRKVIEVSGGMRQWERIRSAKIRLSLSAAGSTKTRDFEMLDDWSSDSALYRRGAIGSTKAPVEHSGQATVTIKKRDGQSRSFPEFDQARVLAGSLPAAAAEVILRKSAYIAKIASGAKCTSETVCVDIYRQGSKHAPFLREEEWLISNSSGFPSSIDLLLPNLLGKRPLYQEFQFSQMIAQGAVQIPGKIEMHHPSGAIQIRTVVSFTPNASFDKAAFDKELNQ